MKYVLLFWGLMAIAYYVATKTKKYYDGTALAEKLLVAVVVVLVFIMGMRMGSDQQVVDSIGAIGVLSVLISVVLWVGTFLAIWITRKVIHMDRYGQRLNATPVMEVAGDEISETAESPAEGSTDLMTVLILAGTLVGVLIGCFYIRTHFTVAELDLFDGISSDAMMGVLCLLVLVIGYGVGLEGKIFREFRKAGLGILLFPAVIIAATGILALGMGLALPQITVRESLAISFGYGWYSFAPGIITAAGHSVAGAISFLHNVIRELVGIVIMPMVARKIGYIECVSVPGIACMDVGLPIIVKSTRTEMIVYAFAVGLVEELVTTVVIPMVIA